MTTASNSSQLCSQRGETLRPLCVLSATGEDATEPADVSKVSLAHESFRLNPDGSLRLDDSTDSKRSLHLRKPMRIGTWNVRTIYQQGKLGIVERECQRNSMKLVGLAEVRWQGKGHFTTENGNMLIYSGPEASHEHGVGVWLDKSVSKAVSRYNPINERMMIVHLNAKPVNITLCQVYAPTSAADEGEIEAFYDTLQDVLDSAPSQDVKIVMGDFIAKVGSDVQLKGIVGEHGLGECNERGVKLIDFCASNGLTVANSMFPHHPRRKYTWLSPDGNTRNQIDYILINSRWQSSIINA